MGISARVKMAKTIERQKQAIVNAKSHGGTTRTGLVATQPKAAKERMRNASRLGAYVPISTLSM
jgi:hypothetical protein